LSEIRNFLILQSICLTILVIKKTVIVGAQGSGKDVFATMLRCNAKSKQYEIIGFIDDDNKLYKKKILGKKILGGLEWFDNQKKNIFCVVAIGDSLIRKMVVKKLELKNVNFVTLIDPSVTYPKNLQIGKGSIIQAGSIINPDTKIGEHVFVNLDSTIGHDCILEDFVTISTGVHLNGSCNVEKEAYIGTGVVTVDKINIGRGSIIGAGAVIVNDIKSNSVYVGNPAKFSKKITLKNRPKL
jgi:sugar O-acyltransferase (sialic acid O-acetyltransferase NeuD family)